jgi:hypothetical protein
MANLSIKTGVISRSMLVGNPPFSPGAFESIATLTAAGGETSLSFTSIPANFQHLQIRFSARSLRTGSAPGSENLNLQFNGDTGANYAFHFLRCDGTNVIAGANANMSQININNAVIASGSSNTTIYSPGIIDIHDYAVTTKNKTVRALCGYAFAVANGRYAVGSGFRNSTSAITSIQLAADGQQFAANSTFALYGIKGA